MTTRKCSICKTVGHISSNKKFHPVSQKPNIYVNLSNGDDVIQLQVSDILLFFITSAKCDNDRHNKIREIILTYILNLKIPFEFYNDIQYGYKWKELKVSWNTVLDKIAKTKMVHKATSVICKHKGGRRFNYDFEIEFFRYNKFIDRVQIEFKNGSTSLSNVPQFLSLQVKSNPFFGMTYDRFYYEHFLDQYIECDKGITCAKPVFTQYEKEVSSIYPTSCFFKQLKHREKVNKEIKDEIVKRSITKYLEKYGKEIDLKKLAEKITKTQTGKIYVFWKQGQFYIDSLEFTNDNDLKLEGIFNGNILRIRNHNVYYNLLLRWRNHKGILNPAWQISLKYIT